MGAATLTDHINRLILYEPGLEMTYPAGSIEAVDEVVRWGDNEATAIALLTRVVELTAEEIDFIRSLPTWSTRLALVPTASRELIAENDWVYQPGWLEGITASTLLLAGSENPPGQKQATQEAAAAIPNSQIRVLEGHAHIAHRTDPAMVAAIIQQFISAEGWENIDFADDRFATLSGGVSLHIFKSKASSGVL